MKPVLTSLAGVFAMCANTQASSAEPVDTGKLPPAATQQVDFVRDIKPILANHCLKCHSEEKPKSAFRLTSRDAALKGGEHGVDIRPGDSANSPLIHYVARLVPDLEMPPEGRGEPLSAEQVALLRAWIDQGTVWEPQAGVPVITASVTPVVGWTSVSGDTNKFRELNWQPGGWNGGLEEFEATSKPGLDSKVTVSGHVLRDDYKLTLSAEKDNLGFARFGWTQFRKYFDDSGGYYPLFTPPAFDLNRDLFLDVGRLWTEVGLTLPNWPRMVLGYEYQYRDGTEATLQWGPVGNGTETRNIYPGLKEISEHVNLLKFDLDYEFAGVLLNDSFRGEWYQLGTRQSNDSGMTLGTPGFALTRATEEQNYFQGANTVHLEKKFADWLFGAGGYLYSNLKADGTMNVETMNGGLLDPNLPPVPGWQSQPIELQRESHVFSLSALLGPWQGASLILGTQNEWTRQSGLGTANVTIALPFDPFIFPIDPPQTMQSDLDRQVFGQTVGFRFTRIPFTALFADARFQQENLGQTEEELNGLAPFLENTDSTSRLTDLRAGFNTSPWRRISLSGQYRYYDNKTDYDHLLKVLPGIGIPYEGYPAFISQRDLISNEAEGKLAWQTAAWLKLTLGYQWLANRYHTTTEPVTIDLSTGQPSNISPGTGLLAGTYDSHVASVNACLTPWRKLFLSATAAYQNARTVTSANSNPSVVPYSGNVYSAILSGNYAFDEKTSLVLSYAFSRADFGEDNLAAGLPLGIVYRQHNLQAGVNRKISKATALGLQYRFYYYDEPSGGGLNNFQANAVFATLGWRL